MKSWLSRQSFLGKDSDTVLEEITLGIIGLGGGGSHIAQQAAHIGIGKYVLIDPDTIDETNLNRLVGGTQQDVKDKKLKVDIAERTIRNVQSKATIIKCATEWQTSSNFLKNCDVIIGGLDSVRAKNELDEFCRRFLIPYIDMGMDVHTIGKNFLISGQVVLSSPNAPCLRCFGITTDESLRAEGERYGAAGGKPQVIWPNGVLASSAIGLLIQLITPWHQNAIDSAYLEYDGNLNTVKISERFKALQGRSCPHFLSDEIGDPGFDIRSLSNKKDFQKITSPASIAEQQNIPWWKQVLRFKARR